MKILLVNNHTQHLEYLMEALQGHEVEVVMYEPGVKLDHSDKDLVILSGGGGEGLEIHDKYRRGKLWYQEQMEFVRQIDKPVIGICMGFEVIARAYGSVVKPMKNGLIQGYFNIQPTDQGHQTFGQAQLLQYKAHSWHVAQAPKDFEVLATSPSGVEIIKHQNRPIMAVQFHPEKGGSLSLPQLIEWIVPQTFPESVSA
jgi:GMP synthase (glutamine-hydrolysing)